MCVRRVIVSVITLLFGLLGSGTAVFASGLSFIHQDHLGSASLITDSQGNNPQKRKYYPFGAIEKESIIGHEPNAYNDKELDAKTKLYNFEARMYAAHKMHFTTPDIIVPDPTNGQSWNRYAYVRNNPIKYIDPTGHSEEDAVFLWGNYGYYNDDGKWITKPDGWAGYHGARKAADAWSEMHPDGSAQVVAIRHFSDLERFMADAVKADQTFGMVAVFGHYGQVDGLRLEPRRKLKMEVLPEDILAQIPIERYAHGVHNGAITNRAEGHVEIRQNGIFRVYTRDITYDGSTIPGTEEVREFAHPDAIVSQGLRKEIFSSNACLAFVGCSSVESAHPWSQGLAEKGATDISAIGFEFGVDLENFGAPALIDYFTQGIIHPEMTVFSPTSTDLDETGAVIVRMTMFFSLVFGFVGLAFAGEYGAESAKPLFQRMLTSLQAEEPLVITAYTALCNNQHVACGASLGNGASSESNLYWSALYGIRTMFNADKSWKEVLKESNPDPDEAIAEVIIYVKHFSPSGRWADQGFDQPIPIYLVAKAYRTSDESGGVTQILSDYFSAVRGAGGGEKWNLPSTGQTIQSGSASHVVGFLGHDYLMSSDLDDWASTLRLERDSMPRGTFVLACASESFFGPYFRGDPHSVQLLMTKKLMAPEAYTLLGLLEGLGRGETVQEIRDRVISEYATYQKRNYPNPMASSRAIFLPSLPKETLP